MDDQQRTMMKRLLDRLLSTRARRDREERLSAPWQAADTELHEIEKAIFRVPLEEQARANSVPAIGVPTRPRHAPTGFRPHLRRATIARTRSAESHGAG